MNTIEDRLLSLHRLWLESAYRDWITLGAGTAVILASLAMGGGLLFVIGDPYLATGACLMAAAVFPIPFIIAFRRIGFVLGLAAFCAWVLLAGQLLYELAPHHSNDGTVLIDALWVAGGWGFGLAYCLVVYAVRELAVSLARRAMQPAPHHL